jgi:hypothetical protein
VDEDPEWCGACAEQRREAQRRARARKKEAKEREKASRAEERAAKKREREAGREARRRGRGAKAARGKGRGGKTRGVEDAAVKAEPAWGAMGDEPIVVDSEESSALSESESDLEVLDVVRVPQRVKDEETIDHDERQLASDNQENTSSNVQPATDISEHRSILDKPLPLSAPPAGVNMTMEEWRALPRRQRLRITKEHE